MCRKHLRSSWLTFLGLIYILGSTECYLKDDYDEDNYSENVNYLSYGEGDDGGDGQDVTDFTDQIQMHKRNPAFTPYVSVGALSNIQQFFENLKENFKTLQSLSYDERKYLLGNQELPNSDGDTKIYRPPATAAFLHAVRNQRPSNRMKSFVGKADHPNRLQRGGSHHFIPALLRPNLGKRH